MNVAVVCVCMHACSFSVSNCACVYTPIIFVWVGATPRIFFLGSMGVLVGVMCVCQTCGVMHGVGHLCGLPLNAKRKSNQGAEGNQLQGGAQDRQRRMTTRIQTETGGQ